MNASTQRQSEPALRYLDPKVLAKISGLELRARLVVEGFFAGMHHSPHHGLSVEFADHRAYTQGDDIRHIDWKVFGKTNKYYIKEYEQETNLELMLMIDCSESMSFRSREDGMSKHEYATTAAASIAYLALHQQDSVGLALFDERLTQFIKPSNNAQQWRSLVRELAGKTGPAKTSLSQAFAELAERLTHRTMIVVISDLFDEVEEVIRGIKHLRYRRHEPIIWNLWDKAELTFPFTGPTLFDGLEAEGRMLVEPDTLRARYLEEVQRFQSRIRSACARTNVDFEVFNTSQSLDAALSRFLATRSARLRTRSSRVLH